MIAIITFLLIAIILFSFFIFAFSLAEYKFGVVFNRPFFIHFYNEKKKLTVTQSYILYKSFPYFTTLDNQNKRYFEHRVVRFINKYEFIGKEDFLITDEVKVLIASTSVMLTFGMRCYLYDIIDKIIVYPSTYYSTVNDTYHKGEFNPRMRAIVFSWEDFKAGFETTSDNLNLGIHEFAHVLHFHGLKSDDASSIIFSRMYSQIQKEVNHPVNKEKLIQSNYFRIYAYTNQFEFLAVILEHYFETPQLFKQEFPKLYQNVSLMLNHKH